MPATGAAASAGRFRSFDRPLVILIAGACVITVAMGVRQTFGLFLGPLSMAQGISIGTLALALAIQNLVWGLAQPFAGAIADRWGARPVVIMGGLIYAGGLALTAVGSSGLAAILGAGILVGIGISATSFAVVLGAVGRSVTPARRSVALGIASAGGSFGQMAMVPVAHGLIVYQGVESALLVLGFLTLLMVPLAIGFARGNAASPDVPVAVSQSLAGALGEASRHGGFRLLTVGFFVCGFQLAFIGIHLPGYLATVGMTPSASAMALGVIGLFNMIGSWLCGVLGARYRPKYLLSALYMLRTVVIVFFMLVPKTEINLLIFAAGMGLAWLGTVPLTSGLLANIFGVQHMGLLFGIVFLNHQVGSFLGAWLGGYLFEITGGYDVVWAITALLGLAAAAIHLPIADGAIRAEA